MPRARHVRARQAVVFVVAALEALQALEQHALALALGAIIEFVAVWQLAAVVGGEFWKRLLGGATMEERVLGHQLGTTM